MTGIAARHCVLVVGMHRSGTSMMAGALKIMGVDFGQKFLGYDQGNVKGHYEHLDILAANEDMLAALKSRWDDPEPLGDRSSSEVALAPFRERIRKVVQRDFGASPLFGIKEPRTTLFLPIYLGILDELSVETGILWMERPFEEIAESLYARDKIPRARALALCRKYTDAVLAASAGRKLVQVGYAEFLRDPRMAAGRIERELGICLRPFDQIQDELMKFVDPGLKHFERGRITRRALGNRLTGMVDALLPFETRRRLWVKRIWTRIRNIGRTAR